ncbi:hypothetical protein [Prosthecobacter sp.]|uniref:hypothetical protein n=1 Tax=Prosthecobacter sp. TaxID=1965333 RepID=UPI00248A5417|nr:hypothetical protein [Prosthecobacter sp.]MDI1311116.1 hypothetical protein [Prosthecobacter sp.]
MKLILTLALVSTSLLLSNCASNGQCIFGKKKDSACCAKPAAGACCDKPAAGACCAKPGAAACKTKH